jgi:hypothetical protein
VSVPRGRKFGIESYKSALFAASIKGIVNPVSHCQSLPVPADPACSSSRSSGHQVGRSRR